MKIKKTLVDGVVRMNAMWRLMSASELYYNTAASAGHQSKTQQLPSSIVTQLRDFAQRRMWSAEEKVMTEIHAIVKTGLSKSLSEAPVVWAALWSVIMLYRQALDIARRNTSQTASNQGT